MSRLVVIMTKLIYPKLRRYEKRVEVVKEPVWNEVSKSKGGEKFVRSKGGRIAEHRHN